MMSMWAPQQGQGRSGGATAGASALLACFLADAGAAMAIRIRIVARLSAREPLARRP